MKIDNIQVGRYGRMRREFIKNERTGLLFSTDIEEHLVQIDTRVKERIWELTRQIAYRYGVTEELKSCDPMAWVGKMNAIKSQAQEIAIREIVEE